MAATHLAARTMGNQNQGHLVLLAPSPSYTRRRTRDAAACRLMEKPQTVVVQGKVRARCECASTKEIVLTARFLLISLGLVCKQRLLFDFSTTQDFECSESKIDELAFLFADNFYWGQIGSFWETGSIENYGLFELFGCFC